MARLINGYDGPFIGKLGTAVGSTWKGIPYIKSAYGKRTGKAGPGETANRKKFAMAQKWLTPIIRFVREGFRNYTPTVEGFLAAKSWMLLNSFEGEKPDIFINPAKVKLSHGILSLSENIRVEKQNESEVHFTWDTGPVPNGYKKDQVMVLAYDPIHRVAEMKMTGEFRETGKEMLKLKTTKEHTYHIYLAFVGHTRTKQSDSVYLGEITVE